MKGKEFFESKIDKNNYEEKFFQEIRGVKKEISVLKQAIENYRIKLKHYLESEAELESMSPEEFRDKYLI